MDPPFETLMQSLKVPAPIQKLCLESGILDAYSFGILAAEEKDMKADIFELLKAGGINMDKVVDQIAVKKLWFACRKCMTGQQGSSAGGQDEEGIPNESEIDLKAQWSRVHGFVLPDAWILTGKHQKQLWAGANAQKPGVEVILMENLRLLSQKSRGIGHVAKCDAWARCSH